MKDEILDLFFDKKMKQKDIAELLNIAKSTVSKIVSKDSRFIAEKSLRKANNKVKRNKDIQRRVEQNRKKVQFKNNSDDLILKQMHSQASMELSKRYHLSNRIVDEHLSVLVDNPSVGEEHVHHITDILLSFRNHEEACRICDHLCRVLE